MFPYLIQVKAVVLFTIFSAISNYVVVSPEHKGRYSVSTGLIELYTEVILHEYMQKPDLASSHINANC